MSANENLLNIEYIKKNLNISRLGKEIIIYNTTSSTNDIAAEYAKGGRKNDGLVIFAEYQTAGRGRAGNIWHSQPAKSILCSVLLYEPDIKPDTVSLTAAVAVAETIGKCGKVYARIKWPNDIMLDNKKVAGILVEAISARRQNFFIIGIGINCHQKKEDFPEELRHIATSIDIQSAGFCDRNNIAKRLLVNLDRYFAEAQKNINEIVEKWKSMSILLGRHITVRHNRRDFSGICIGIEPSEGLILQLQRGGVKIFDAATTSIVKD